MSAFSANQAADRDANGLGPIVHGGDLDAARRLFPQAPQPWIDLSTGINPVPYPLPHLEASAFERLPSRADLRALKAVAARAYAVPSPQHVAAAPGSQILIDTLPRLFPRARVAVVGPTYAEHAAAWRRAGHEVDDVAQPPNGDRHEIVVVVDPNNPDGRVVPPQTLGDLARRLKDRGGILVLDEAFADLEPDRLSSPFPTTGSVRLRSFGKSYGLAGLRLGFALSDPALAGRIEAALGPWAVSGPAIAVGRQALADASWRANAAAACAELAARLDRLILHRAGRIVGGTVLFRLAAFDDGPGTFRRLGEAGIYVRRFPEAPDRLRFGLPVDDRAWCRLSRALKPR